MYAIHLLLVACLQKRAMFVCRICCLNDCSKRNMPEGRCTCRRLLPLTLQGPFEYPGDFVVCLIVRLVCVSCCGTPYASCCDGRPLLCFLLCQVITVEFACIHRGLTGHKTFYMPTATTTTTTITTTTATTKKMTIANNKCNNRQQ